MIKKKLLEIFNKNFLTIYQHGLFSTIDQSKLINLINKIKVYDLGYELIRIGPNGDGGYLIPNILNEIKICLSPGVGNIHGFETELLNRGIKVYMADKTVKKPNLNFNNYEFLKKNIGSYNDDETLTLDRWMQQIEHKNDMLLQMDIEGSEYEALLKLEEENLQKFKIMIVEFHHFEQVLTKIGYKVISNVFEKILKYFDVAHIHPNNCCGVYKLKKIEIPSTLEITFLRKDFTLQKNKVIGLPNKLDHKNVNEKTDIILDHNWY